jgi:hypothetical protein
MAKKKVITPIVIHKEPSYMREVYLFIGEKYYKRLQPTPYAHKPIDFKKIKKIFCSIN